WTCGAGAANEGAGAGTPSFFGIYGIDRTASRLTTPSCPVLLMRLMTSSGVMDGNFWKSRAATPATIGEANDVPASWLYSTPPSMAGTAVLMTCVPGAKTSTQLP